MKNYCKIFCLLLVLPIICYSNNSQNKYYRVAIVAVDSIKLDNGTVLKAGEFEQIISSKSTEEATFVRTELDSALVYAPYLRTLYWLNEDIIVNSDETVITLKNDRWNIFEDLLDSQIVISKGFNKFVVPEDKIFFDNKKFYQNMFKQ
jgi:hypothetical protein